MRASNSVAAGRESKESRRRPRVTLIGSQNESPSSKADPPAILARLRLAQAAELRCSLALIFAPRLFFCFGPSAALLSSSSPSSLSLFSGAMEWSWWTPFSSRRPAGGAQTHGSVSVTPESKRQGTTHGRPRARPQPWRRQSRRRRPAPRCS